MSLNHAKIVILALLVLQSITYIEGQTTQPPSTQPPTTGGQPTTAVNPCLAINSLSNLFGNLGNLVGMNSSMNLGNNSQILGNASQILNGLSGLSNLINCGVSSNITFGPPNGAPQAPPRPPSAPTNYFANVDPRVAFVISLFGPSLTNQQVAVYASNRSVWGPYYDSFVASPSNTFPCNAGMQMYQYMEDQIVLFNDSCSWVTNARLNTVLKCKPDCNFQRLLSVSSCFSSNVTAFALNAISNLNPRPAGQCRQQFPQLQATLGNLNANQLQSNPAQISFMHPSQLGALSSGDALTVAMALNSNSGQQLSPQMAMSLGRNIPPNTPLTSIASIASSVPLSCFANTNPSQLVSLISTMDTGNMSPARKQYLGSKIASSGNASVLASFLANTNDPNMINSIPASMFSSLNINISNIPPANLPKSYQKQLATQTLASQGLAAITSTTTLAQILPGITKSSINSIPSSSAPATLTNIANASIVNSIPITGIQRSNMLNALLTALYANASTTNLTVALNYLSTSQLSVLYPLFIEANSTILTAFSQLSTFTTVISNVADLSATSCCSYSRSGRALFTSFAAPFLFNYYNLDLSDLYSLGPCLASTLSATYLQALSPSTFITYFSTLGNAFQPDATQVPVVQQLIAAYAANTTVMASTSQSTLLFSALSDLAIFFPFSTYASNITTWSTNGGALMSTITAARSPSVSANQLCQIGMSSAATSAYTTLINTYGSIFATQYVASVSTAAAGRKKRQSSSYTFTCTDLTTMGSGISSLTAAQLSTLSTSNFSSCQTLIGLASNSWSSSQLAVLAATAISLYTSPSQISDANIAALNSVLLGFTQTQLSQLVFTSTTSISALGALSGWSSAQLSGLSTPLTNYINTNCSGSVTSDLMTSSSHLLCAFSSAQVTNVTSAMFTASISTLSGISMACPNMANWYTLAKTVSTYATPYSSLSVLSELGAVISGITTTDIALVSADGVSSITTSALQYMPAATVNTLSSTQLAGLAVDQVSALMNSPYYSSFSASLQASLQSSATGTTVTANSASSLVFSKLSLGLYAIFLVIFYH